MNSRARKDFDSWFTENYDDLLQVTRRLHRDHRDLLHYTYIACVKALENNLNILDDIPAYVHRSLWNNHFNGFRKLYFISDSPKKNQQLVSNYDIQEAIRKEEALIMANHLSWFDRKVLELYLDGWSMAELARQSGIDVNVLYKSISTSKNKLRNVISQRASKS
jgi:DNA-directed RNA polymerase specialized sigma24 family protein